MSPNAWQGWWKSDNPLTTGTRENFANSSMVRWLKVRSTTASTYWLMVRAKSGTDSRWPAALGPARLRPSPRGEGVPASMAATTQEPAKSPQPATPPPPLSPLSPEGRGEKEGSDLLVCQYIFQDATTFLELRVRQVHR